MFNRLIKTSIYLLVFLLPLFFLPFSFEAFEFNKQYLLFFLVSLAFFAWFAKMVLIDKEIRFKRTLLDIPILAFLFAVILSAVFSADKSSSIFGFYGRFSNGLIGLLSLAAMYFLITNNTRLRQSAEAIKPVLPGAKEPDKDNKESDNGKEEKRQAVVGQRSSEDPLTIDGLLKPFMWSVFFVILISYLSIFGVWAKLSNLFGENFSLPQVMLQRTFNPVSGSLEGLAVFLAVVLVFLTGRILTAVPKAKESGKALNYLLLAACLILLVIIDFAAAWIILFVSLVLFAGIALAKRLFREDVNKLLLPILLSILAFTFIFIDTVGLQALILNFQLPREVVLDQGESWKIGLSGATESIKSGFLGTGIGTFHYAFTRFKSAEFNQNQFWQIRFDRSASHISEMLATIGFLGLFLYLSIAGLFLVFSWYFLKLKIIGQSLIMEKTKLMVLPLLMLFFALLIAQFAYYQNTVLAFTFWLVLGLSVVSWQKPVKEKKVSFKDFPELSLVFSILLIILGLAFLTGYFFAGKFYWADMNYAKAQRMLWAAERIQLMERAVRLNPALSQYQTILARVYLNEALQELLKPPAEQDAARFEDMAARAINIARAATDSSPNQVTTWETLGMVYREIRLIAPGALEWGIKSFERAVELEPTNPVLRTELGKLYLAFNERERAKKEFEKARELRPDYVDALVQIALVYEAEDNLEEAIRQVEGLVVSYPFAEVLFQLGRLYFNVGRTDDAIFQLEQAINLAPNYSDALYSLGVAYRNKGETAKAIAMFERVLELNPGNIEVLRTLEELKQEPSE